MKRLIGLFLMVAMVCGDAFALTIEVPAGDEDALIDAIRQANEAEPAFLGIRIRIIPGAAGDNEFVFTMPLEGSNAALPEITNNIFFTNAVDQRITFRATGDAGGTFRLANVTGSLQFTGFCCGGWAIEGFGIENDSGGAIFVINGSFIAFDTRFRSNRAGGNGGAVALFGQSRLELHRNEFLDNRSGNLGGAVSMETTEIKENISVSEICSTVFRNNRATVFGADLNVNTENFLLLCQNLHDGPSEVVKIENQRGFIQAVANTFSGAPATIDSTASVQLHGNVISDEEQNDESRVARSAPVIRPEDLCKDFGSNAFRSLGYNISSDETCNLNHATDLADTDPVFEHNEDDLLLPAPGNPAIDSGATDVITFNDLDLTVLPCGYRDLAGTGRPQDADGDGVFECDRGAMEIPGTGRIVPGHSGAFFNALRDREGTYVEILNETTAVVYTFTYRPDGSGPAWFIGVGTINGNSIVIDDLLRPTGTSFGENFVAADVQFTPNGGMSMVFPDCQAAAPGGNVAYSGDIGQGYEGLITRAARLSHITGCGDETPHPNAGLSASYFDPARDGEGVIVEWLPNGQVLVVFFTYDQNDDQLWLLGIGTAQGKTVTMDALFATTYTRWGSDFDTTEITLSSWGSFTLTWTACNQVIFDYSSTVAGFGSATRNYSRLSTLAGTSCPDF
jgi:hypothetical protein